MKFQDVVQQFRIKAQIYPFIMAINGIIGSGKSYETEDLKPAWLAYRFFMAILSLQTF